MAREATPYGPFVVIFDAGSGGGNYGTSVYEDGSATVTCFSVGAMRTMTYTITNASGTSTANVILTCINDPG